MSNYYFFCSFDQKNYSIVIQFVKVNQSTLKINFNFIASFSSFNLSVNYSFIPCFPPLFSPSLTIFSFTTSFYSWHNYFIQEQVVQVPNE